MSRHNDNGDIEHRREYHKVWRGIEAEIGSEWGGVAYRALFGMKWDAKS